MATKTQDCSIDRVTDNDERYGKELHACKYFLKLEGDNNLKKARAWLGKYETWNLRNLEVGACYLQIGSKAKFLRLPEFQAQKLLVQARG